MRKRTLLVVRRSGPAKGVRLEARGGNLTLGVRNPDADFSANRMESGDDSEAG